MQNRMLVWVVASTMLLGLGGCASRGWVRDHIGQTEKQLDQKIGQVETQVAQDSQRLTGMESQLGRVEAQVGQVDSRATEQAQRLEAMGSRVLTLQNSVADASGAASDARARADSVDARLTRLWDNRYRRSVVDTVSVPFGFNKADLSDGAQTALLGVVRELEAKPTLSVQLEGYTDSRGAREYNYSLSQRRVESVRRFLARQGVELDRIQFVGLGPIEDRGVPDRDKRRVTVKLLTNGD